MIELTEVVKEYRTGWTGRDPLVRALDSVSLHVPEGTVLGIVGLNGAGKSTLLRLLLGYIRPTAGTVSIDGIGPRDFAEREGVAYVPEKVTIPRHWTVRGALRAYAMLGNLEADAWNRVDAAIHRLGLDPIADRRIDALSKGNLQRLALAQAILGERRLMVLDEPTDGLDPVWIAELRSIVEEWRAADPRRVVILASHNLPEVERLANRTLMLHNGRTEGDLPLNGPGTLEERFLEKLRQLGEPRP
jgi:ABC-type multidrug transport system ATPase subunit